MALPEPSLDPHIGPSSKFLLRPGASWAAARDTPGHYPGTLGQQGYPRPPPGLAPWWTGPQLDFPREKIQNREAILNFFEFVAFEAGHPYHPGKAPRRPGRAWEGMKHNFQV